MLPRAASRALRSAARRLRRWACGPPLTRSAPARERRERAAGREAGARHTGDLPSAARWAGFADASPPRLHAGSAWRRTASGWCASAPRQHAGATRRRAVSGWCGRISAGPGPGRDRGGGLAGEMAAAGGTHLPIAARWVVIGHFLHGREARWEVEVVGRGGGMEKLSNHHPIQPPATTRQPPATARQPSARHSAAVGLWLGAGGHWPSSADGRRRATREPAQHTSARPLTSPVSKALAAVPTRRQPLSRPGVQARRGRAPPTHRSPPNPPGVQARRGCAPHHPPLAAKPARRAGETLVRAPTAHPAAAAEPTRRAGEARARPGTRGTGQRAWIATVPGPPLLSGPLARFSPVLERAGSRVGRRPIAEGDATAGSALDAARGSTTLPKKRVAQRPPPNPADTGNRDVSPDAPHCSAGAACSCCRSATGVACASPRGPRPNRPRGPSGR
ncbi:hypothetical protein RKD28_004479 [Streptomyces sp. SAI-229]